MTLLVPIGLLALLTLPVIVVLHLLRERRRRVAVPSLLHWLNIPRRPEGERIRRLPLTLLLLLHLLIAALLGLALGQPQLAGAPSGAARQTAIVLDTSTSMAARTGAGTRFSEAQARARALLRELRPGDQAAIIAAGPVAQLVAEGGAGDIAALAARLDRLRPGGDGADMAGALTLAQATLDPQRERRVVAISDRGPAQAGATADVPADWLVVGDDQPNRAIIGFAARPWGDRLQIYARAANYADAPFRTTLRLYGDERLIDTRDLRLDAGGETELTWTLPGDHTTLRTELDGRDAQPADDQGYLAVAPAPPVKVLLVSAKPDALHRALAAARTHITVVDPSRYTEAPAAGPAVDLTVFDGFLPSAWPAGAVLAINPPPGNPLLAIGALPEPASDGELAQYGTIFEGLSLGGINFGLVQSVQPPAWATTQLAIGGQPLILRGRNGAHEVAIWAFDLTSSNLPSRVAFPLLVARTVRDLTPAPLPAAIQAGAPLPLRPDPRATTLQAVGPDGTRTTVAAAPALVLNTLTQPGFYRIEGPGLGGQVGVNAGSVVESDLRQPDGAPPEQPPRFTAPAQANDEQRHALDIWPWLALGALALLMLEWGYIHR
jgi:von Willebrand factor type A domain/Aerotolerance regulator N-terminal